MSQNGAEMCQITGKVLVTWYNAMYNVIHTKVFYSACAIFILMYIDCFDI